MARAYGSYMSTPTRADRAGDSQALPTMNENPPIHDIMVADVQQMFGFPVRKQMEHIRVTAERRKALGIERYGTPLQAFNGRNAKLDAYEEAHDFAVYLRQWIYELEEMGAISIHDKQHREWVDAWSSYERFLTILVTIAGYQPVQGDPDKA
jgi:hypothetical protein